MIFQHDLYSSLALHATDSLTAMTGSDKLCKDCSVMFVQSEGQVVVYMRPVLMCLADSLHRKRWRTELLGQTRITAARSFRPVEQREACALQAAL